MHCFHDLVNPDNPGNDVIVGFGIHDLCVDTKVAHQSWQITKAKKIHHTETFDPESFNNDIAIVEVVSDIKLNQNAQPACLPTKEFLPGTLLFVSGWGHDESKFVLFFKKNSFLRFLSQIKNIRVNYNTLAYLLLTKRYAKRQKRD